MSKLSAVQVDVIDSSLSEEDVPTNEEIVSNQLRSVDNTSIDVAHNINKNIKLPKRNCAIKFSNGKRAYPALDVAAPMEMKRGELLQLANRHELQKAIVCMQNSR